MPHRVRVTPLYSVVSQGGVSRPCRMVAFQATRRRLHRLVGAARSRRSDCMQKDGNSLRSASQTGCDHHRGARLPVRSSVVGLTIVPRMLVSRSQANPRRKGASWGLHQDLRMDVWFDVHTLPFSRTQTSARGRKSCGGNRGGGSANRPTRARRRRGCAYTRSIPRDVNSP